MANRFRIQNPKFRILLMVTSAFLVASCAKKPVELYKDGLKSFAAGNYEKAQENFSDGIRKNDQADSFDRSDSLYAGFIAANLVTGKYASINSAYNDFTKGIHDSLINLYGQRAMKMVEVTSEITPYKTGGGNRLPPDFPQTVVIQAIADHQGFYNIKQQIDGVVKK
jgi:hypothetical protein